MHIMIDNPGRYARGAVIGVKVLNEQGEEVEDNGGARFFVKTNKKGQIVDAFAMPELKDLVSICFFLLVILPFR